MRRSDYILAGVVCLSAFINRGNEAMLAAIALNWPGAAWQALLAFGAVYAAWKTLSYALED